jgi:hypothetical protein
VIRVIEKTLMIYAEYTYWLSGARFLVEDFELNTHLRKGQEQVQESQLSDYKLQIRPWGFFAFRIEPPALSAD